MATDIVIYERIKEVLDANMATLTSQIELNRELVSVKLEEVKKNTEELKVRAKEMNGQVKINTGSVMILKEKQEQESKRRKRMWAVSFAVITTMFTALVSYIVHKFSGIN